jgi:hypothetical protein
MPHPLEQLFGHIKNYYRLGDEAREALYESFEQLVLTKNDYLVQEGEICRHLYFIQQGALREKCGNLKMQFSYISMRLYGSNLCCLCNFDSYTGMVEMRSEKSCFPVLTKFLCDYVVQPTQKQLWKCEKRGNWINLIF